MDDRGCGFHDSSGLGVVWFEVIQSTSEGAEVVVG